LLGGLRPGRLLRKNEETGGQERGGKDEVEAESERWNGKEARKPNRQEGGSKNFTGESRGEERTNWSLSGGDYIL